MSFDNIHYGSYGDEKVTSSSKIGGQPLGIKMILPDGREFVHARIGGTAVAQSTGMGRVIVAATGALGQAATTYASKLAASVDYAVGATSIVLATNTAAVTTDRFAEGFLTVASSTGAGGFVHKVKSSSSAAAASANFTVSLYETDGIKVATSSATTYFGLAENPYAAVELHDLGTASVAPVVGVFVAASAAASAYVWLQTRGPAPVWTGGTVLRNREPVVCSTAIAGAVVPVILAATAAYLDSTRQSLEIIGIGMLAAAASGFSTVDLRIS